MAFRFTAAPSSKISKSKSKKTGLSKMSSTVFQSYSRQKPGHHTASAKTKPNDRDQEALTDLGLVRRFQCEFKGNDVESALQYMQISMFEDVPLRRSGLNSTKTAEILNYRRALPPIASVSHLYSLLKSPTKVQREIAILQRDGKAKKLVIPFRGSANGIEELLVLKEQWLELLQNEESISDVAKDKLARYINSTQHDTAASIPRLSATEATTAVHAGFLVVGSSRTTTSEQASTAGSTLSGTLTSLSRVSENATRPQSQSLEQQPQQLGDDNDLSVPRPASRSEGFNNENLILVEGESTRGTYFTISVPGIGSYVRLLSSSIEHMMSLLQKNRYKELPLSSLRDRWNGSVAGDDLASVNRQARGEFSGILPGRTKRWKQLYGITFEFVMCECLGQGMIELFETGSVGLGVRKIE